MVLGNPVRLRQMVGNLVGNAIKYTQPGGKIIVRGNAQEEQFILQVIDNGPGIPPAEQPYIFDKFYRASNVSSDTNGTGLGLAIVKSIVDNHQGRISVDFDIGSRRHFHGGFAHQYRSPIALHRKDEALIIRHEKPGYLFRLI